MDFNFDASWKKSLEAEFNKTYFAALSNFVEAAYKKEVVFPAYKDIFFAFKLCSLKNTKVVILGQDPYHNEGQAQGLAFSVNNVVAIPPSLKNIFTELESDIGKSVLSSENLEDWAKQGVLLLNTTLTVKADTPNSHKGLGWEIFTDAVIKIISEEKNHVVFILWGKSAAKKIRLIDTSKHLVITSVHPSPLSAYRGFFGSRPFSQTNKFLLKHGLTEIQW